MSFGKLLRAWLVILLFMSANGALRELVLKRFLPEAVAEALSVAFGIAIILALTRFLLRPLAGKASSDLVRASVVLVLLTVAFEFLFGHYVSGRSWQELLHNYAIWDGRLWPVALATIAFVPFLWGRWSIAEKPHARR